MKWYLLSHLLNLYVLPVTGYMILKYIFVDADIFAYEEALFFGYIPSGCFLISFVYGLRKRKSPFSYCFVCSFLCIPLAILDSTAKDGLFNYISVISFLYCAYFLIAFMGNITALAIYSGCAAIKKIWNIITKH